MRGARDFAFCTIDSLYIRAWWRVYWKRRVHKDVGVIAHALCLCEMRVL